MSLATKYAMKKRMAKGGMAKDCPPGVCCDKHVGDVVGAAMHKRKMMSEGGMVADDIEPVADSEPNQFDELAKDDDLDFSYTAEDSGDEDGDSALDDDSDDVVSRAMKARKGRMPRPA